MAIRFVCPLCWAVREDVQDAQLGKLIKCYDCHAMSVATHTPDPNSRTLPLPPPPHAPPPLTTRPIEPALPTPTSPPAVPMASTPPVDEMSRRARSILYCTGDIRRRYEIVDLVFAHGTSTHGVLKGTQTGQAFQVLVQWLGQAALQLDADAVIHIHFDFRPTAEPGAFEVYAYGTAVKIDHDPELP